MMICCSTVAAHFFCCNIFKPSQCGPLQLLQLLQVI